MLFHIPKMHLLALFWPFKDWNDKFPYSFTYFNSRNFYPLVNLKLGEKGTFFGRSLHE